LTLEAYRILGTVEAAGQETLSNSGHALTGTGVPDEPGGISSDPPPGAIAIGRHAACGAT